MHVATPTSALHTVNIPATHLYVFTAQVRKVCDGDAVLVPLVPSEIGDGRQPCFGALLTSPTWGHGLWNHFQLL
jgi:hypothetical protein